jgi:pimeloyl-ACP methyl ester carboxylesterase
LPRGGGQPVLVIPGFLTGDISTVAIRGFLRSLGYRAYRWGHGRNTGHTARQVPKVIHRLQEIEARHSAPVKLIGWSHGGVLAREAAREAPRLVERIITLGTPVVGGPKYTMAAKWYRDKGVALDELEEIVAQRNQIPLAMKVVAIYSRKDEVVAWRACLDPNPKNQVEHIEVDAGHAELGFSAPVLKLVADKLVG